MVGAFFVPKNGGEGSVANRIKGITVEIGGDTTKLSAALKGVNSDIKNTQTQLKDVNRLLKLDPTNTELLSQKQKLLKQEIGDTKTKLDALKEASKQAQEQLNNGEITTEQYDALQREIVETENELEKLETELKKTDTSFGATMKSAGEKVSAVGGKIQGAGTTITKGVTVPLMAVGATALKSFDEVDDGYDTIVKKTGATGKQLDSLKKSADNVFGSMPTDIDSVGIAVGEVNTRFGVTGKKLESMSASFIKFAEINDTDLNASIGNTSKIMEQWGVKTSQTKNVLGLLTAKAQETGISVDTLMSSVQKNGATFKSMGLSLSQSISLLANFEANGVNAETAIAALRKASVNYAKDGKSMDAGLKETMKAIKGAKTETEALNIATGVFGTKGASEMTTAIREGRISLKDLTTTMKGYGTTVDDTYNGTLDGVDNFKTAMNNVKLAMSGLGNAISEVLGPMLNSLSGKIKGVTQWFNGLSPQMQQTIVKIGMVVAAVGPVLVIIGKVISIVGTAMTVISKVSTVINTVKGAFAALNTTMLANPIVLIVAAIAALVAAFIYLWNNCDSFRQFWIDLWENIKQVSSNVWNAIKTTFETIWNAISTTAVNVWNTITGTITAVWNGIKSFFLTIWNGIKTIFTTVLGAIFTVIKAKFQLYKTIITTVINAIKTVKANEEVKQKLEAIPPQSETLRLAIENATSLITAATTGHVVTRPEEILIMDTDDMETARKVWRWNLNGLGYSSTGYKGTYGTAITMDGQINGRYIAAKSIYADSLIASELQTAWNGITNYIQLKNGELQVYNSANKKVSAFNSNGEHFYRDDVYVGSIGTNQWAENASHKGLVFDLEYEGKYMAWCYQLTSNAGLYTTMLCFSQGNSIYNEKGLHLGCDFYGEWFTLNNFNIGKISSGGYEAYTGTIPIVTGISKDGDKYTADKTKIHVANGIIVGYW